jgi:hypothetical protein
MKGLVFTEFLEMVEAAHGMKVTDRLLDVPGLTDDGAYTSVGTYDFGELALMVGELSSCLDVSAAELLRGYGEYLFARFALLYPAIVKQSSDWKSMLESVQGYIHVEVRKLYPDAELPHFSVEEDGDGLVMRYQSVRPLANFAEGLIIGCLKYFGSDRTVTCKMTGALDGTTATFKVR